MAKRMFSLAPLAVLELTPPNQVTCAAEAGFDALELRIFPATPTEAVYPTVGDTPMVREIKKRLDDTGIKLINVELIRLTPDMRPVHWLPFLETGAKLGSPNVIVAANDPDHSRMLDNFCRLSELAFPFGLTLNLEFTPFGTIKNIAETAEFLKKANRPNTACMIDVYHYDRGGSTVDQLKLLPENSLRFMHLCDAPKERPTNMDALLAEVRGARLAPGTGGIDMVPLLRALPRDLPISLEVVNLEIALRMSPVDRSRKFLNDAKAWLDKVLK